MNKNSVIGGAILILLAIILGAFGAHGLETSLNEELGGIAAKKSIESYKVGVQYQMYHGLGILLIAIIGHLTNRSYKVAAIFMYLGVLLFSGSIYLLALRPILGIDTWTSFLGPITPIGGLCFIIGWVLVIVKSLRPVK